jgi:hypothetical protein
MHCNTPIKALCLLSVLFCSTVVAESMRSLSFRVLDFVEEVGLCRSTL